jgi:hypothetical protein
VACANAGAEKHKIAAAVTMPPQTVFLMTTAPE